jgi:hypothetical protein
MSTSLKLFQQLFVSWLSNMITEQISHSINIVSCPVARDVEFQPRTGQAIRAARDTTGEKAHEHDQAIAAILSAIRELMNPPPPKRRPIGFTADLDTAE